MRPTMADQFVEAVYRRSVVYRILEQLGLGMLVASALAIVLNLLAIWQSMPTLPVLLFSACVGLAVAIALLFHRWPTRLLAVIETDRQLGFDDLLTSAIFPPARNDDDFLNIVRALANTKCQQHSPSDVFLRRLSARMWTAVGLAASIAVILGVIPFGAVQSQATDANAAVLSDSSAGPVETSNQNLVQNLRDPTSEGSWNAQASSEQKTDGVASESKNSRGIGNGSSFGGGSVTKELVNDQGVQNRSAEGAGSVGGDAAGGGGSSTNPGQHVDNVVGQKSGISRASDQTPAYAGGDITSGPAESVVPSHDRIPPEDRDLIRDFFNGQ